MNRIHRQDVVGKICAYTMASWEVDGTEALCTIACFYVLIPSVLFIIPPPRSSSMILAGYGAGDSGWTDGIREF